MSCQMVELSQRSGGVLQMEKRGERACGDSDKYPRCRLVLQRALTHNLQNLPGAAQLCQAWGLLEVRVLMKTFMGTWRPVCCLLSTVNWTSVALIA